MMAKIMCRATVSRANLHVTKPTKSEETYQIRLHARRKLRTLTSPPPGERDMHHES